MIRTLTVAAGLAIGAGSAQGAFVGFQFVEGDSAAASAFAGAGAITFQLFALFDAPGDGAINTVVRATYNISTTGGATFFNTTTPFGSDLPPIGAFANAFPELLYDTYGTIGARFSDDPGGADVATDPGAAITSTHIGGGWFNSNPPNHVGAAIWYPSLASSFGTLLFNITVSTPDAGASLSSILTLINGTFSIFEQGPNGALIEHGLFAPTPNTLGLIGIAGLAATRRRRR